MHLCPISAVFWWIIARIGAKHSIKSLEKVTNQCYLLMSSVKKLLHKYPTLWSEFLSCKLFNSWKIQKIRQLQNCNQGLHPPLPTIFTPDWKVRLFLLSKTLAIKHLQTFKNSANPLCCSKKSPYPVQKSSLILCFLGTTESISHTLKWCNIL